MGEIRADEHESLTGESFLAELETLWLITKKIKEQEAQVEAAGAPIRAALAELVVANSKAGAEFDFHQLMLRQRPAILTRAALQAELEYTKAGQEFCVRNIREEVLKTVRPPGKPPATFIVKPKAKVYGYGPIQDMADGRREIDKPIQGQLQDIFQGGRFYLSTSRKIYEVDPFNALADEVCRVEVSIVYPNG